MLGKTEGGRRGWKDEMVGWHHQHNRHEFEWAPGVGDRQGSLVCCSPWGRRVGHDWATELNRTSVTALKRVITVDFQSTEVKCHRPLWQTEEAQKRSQPPPWGHHCMSAAATTPSLRGGDCVFDSRGAAEELWKESWRRWGGPSPGSSSYSEAAQG